MPPPSSPDESRRTTWDLSSTSISNSDRSDNEIVEDDSYRSSNNGNYVGRRMSRSSRLHSLNLLSSLFLNPRYMHDDIASWRNANSPAVNEQLRINNVPIEIRNINLDEVEPLRAILTDSSDDDYEYNEFEVDYENENIDNDDDHDSDDYHNEDNPEIGFNNDNDTLRSDIQMNERLLLSSARQNHTNTNTIISLEDNNNTNDDISSNAVGGVSLRRQNAIRLRPRGDSDEKVNKSVLFRMRKEAKAVYKDIHMVFTLLKSLRHFPDESPLFSGHNTLHRFPNKHYRESTENIFSNLDTVMDNFLLKSKSGKLWQTKEFKTKSKKHRHSSKKRRVSFDNHAHVKRQKIQTTVYPIVSQTNNLSLEDLNFNTLRLEQRKNILNVLSSSFLKVGSLFNLRINRESRRNIDGIFTFVDYKSKSLEGFFSISANTDSNNDNNIIYQKLRAFKNYFTGTGFGIYNTPRNKILGKKLKLIDNLNEDINYTLKITETTQPIKSFTIPFNGSMIDFTNNDLRFLSYIEMSSNLRIRNLHVARAKSARVRLQLGEWMKINPFRKFRETILIQKLKELDESLRSYNYSKLPTNLKEEHIESGKGIVVNIFDLTKDFDFVKYRDASVPILEEEEIIREFKVDDDKPNYFLQNWQRSLGDKLSEFLTCEDCCLLKIQLNYILFTLSVDLNKFLDDYIDFVLNFCSEPIRKKYEGLLKNLVPQNSSDDSKNAILLCSLNRKSGEIEMQNTRAYLNYRDIYQLDLQIRNRNNFARNSNDPPTSSEGYPVFISSEDDADDETYAEECKYQDPYLQEYPTILDGCLKSSNFKSNSIGGGNPSYGFV